MTLVANASGGHTACTLLHFIVRSVCAVVLYIERMRVPCFLGARIYSDRMSVRRVCGGVRSVCAPLVPVPLDERAITTQHRHTDTYTHSPRDDACVPYLLDALSNVPFACA